MPTYSRRAFNARNLPGRPSILLLPHSNDEECCNPNHQNSRNSGELKRKPKRRETPAARCRLFNCNLIKRRRRLVVAIAPEQVLQFFHFGVRLARAVPQIIVLHSRVLPTFTHGLSLFCSFIPRPMLSPRLAFSPPAFHAASSCRDAS